MGRREPKGSSLEEFQKAYRQEMLNQAGPLRSRVVFDKEVCLIEEAISALKKLPEDEMSEEVNETIQAVIEDLSQCI